MLKKLTGRTWIEKTKALLIVVLLVTVGISQKQLWDAQSAGRSTTNDRVQVATTATEFTKALTTFDFAHLDVQSGQIKQISTESVLKKVQADFSELQTAHATSIEVSTKPQAVDLEGSHATVLLTTDSRLQTTFIPPGTLSTRTLSCKLLKLIGGWRVSDFNWISTSSSSTP